MTNKKIVLVFLLITCLALAIPACHLPEGKPPETRQDVPTATPAPAQLTDFTPTPTSTPAAALPVQNCNPIVTTTTIANVRSGPGTVYGIVGSIPQGGTAPVAGKSADSTWWYIQFPGGAGGYAWIAASVTTATCIPATLPVIAAPPAPEAPPPSITPTGSGPLLFFPGIYELYKSPTPTFEFFEFVPLFPQP